MTGLHFNIVENNKLFTQALSFHIQRTYPGCKISTYSSGVEYLSKLTEETPDIVLMDIEMPGLNGFETISTAKKLKPEVKHIVVSQFSHQEYTKKAKEAKADGYVSKSDIINYLESAVDNILNNKTYFNL